VIEVKGLIKDFGKLNVLKGIDVHISKGEVVVIIGPSGK
jgi:ABC-type polar amino acid transport system ATPase subunit